MNQSSAQLMQFFDELLLIIWKKLDNVDVLFSWIQSNPPLDRIICDPCLATEIDLIQLSDDESCAQSRYIHRLILFEHSAKNTSSHQIVESPIDFDGTSTLTLTLTSLHLAVYFRLACLLLPPLIRTRNSLCDMSHRIGLLSLCLLRLRLRYRKHVASSSSEAYSAQVEESDRILYISYEILRNLTRKS